MIPNGLRPAAELAADKPHGTRIRYIAGCRCTLCRSANARYESERSAARKSGDWNGLVSATQARKHLLMLSKHGVGRRAVAASTDISQSVLSAIRSGEKTHIRKRTEKKILAVTNDCISDGAIVSAKKTWSRINQLLEEGYSKEQIALNAGLEGAHLQLGKTRVLAITALKIEQFYQTTQI